VIWPLYKKRTEELKEVAKHLTTNKDGRAWLHSTEITAYYNEHFGSKGGKTYNTTNIDKTFLEELHNHNYLEKIQDPTTNKIHYLHSPLVEVDEETLVRLGTMVEGNGKESGKNISEDLSLTNLQNSGRFCKNLHFMRLTIPENYSELPENWLELQILEDFGCGIDNADFKIRDKNGLELPIQTWVQKYESPKLRLSHFFETRGDGFGNGKSENSTKTNPSNGGTIVKIITETVKTDETVQNWPKFGRFGKKDNDNGGGGNGKGNGINALSETKAIAVSEPVQEQTEASATPLSHYIPSQPAQQRQMLLVEAYELERQEQAKVNNEDKTLLLLNEQRKAIPPDLHKLYEASVSVDPEWVDERDKDGGIRRIYAMSFVDWKGREMVFHIDDYTHLEGSLFEQTRAMLNDIFDYWFSNGYRMSFGFNSLGDGSDREVVFENAQHYNTTIQPVEETVVGSHNKNRRAYYKFKERELRHTHIDWYRIFENKAVWTYIFEQKYRTFGLDTISRALFDVGKYKVDGLQATQQLSVEEQKMYVLQDSRLLSLLTTAENGNLFGAMQYIADLLELPLPKVCHSQVSQYWTVIYEKMDYQVPPLVDKINPETGETETIAQNYYFKTKTVVAKRGKNKDIPNVKVVSYSGGRVLEPTPGFYRDVIGLDQESQYPTIGILLNLGFETMCCSHEECKNDPACQVKYTGDPDVDGAGYYICKLQGDSAYKQRLTVFRDARIRAKNNGERVKDLALKIIINGAYGVYGYKKFAFADTRVAEVTTAVARKMHKAMEELAKSEVYNFNVIGGDTDSIFITYPSEGAADKIGAFCNEFKEHYKITIKPSKKYWSKMLITGKKHYIYWEWGNEGNPTIKGMEGAKNNVPKLTNIVFDQFVKNIGADRDFISDLKRAWTKEYQYCKKHRPDLLQIEVRLGKNPADYVGDKLIKRLGIHQGKGKDDTIRYYEIGKENEAKYGLDAYLNPEYIDDEIYKQKFFISPFEDALKHLGYDVREVCS
jgi:DNA polymerase elongation subunit (family B)